MPSLGLGLGLPRLNSAAGFDLSVGLVARYRADGALWQDSARTTPATADGALVGAWDDLSGAGRHLLQATNADRPALKLSIQNGKPIVRLDGSVTFLQAAFTLVQPEHVFIVYKSRVIGAGNFNDCVFDGANNQSMGLYSNTVPQTVIYGGLSLVYNANVCNGVFGQITALFNSAGGVTASYIRENGVTRVTGDPSNLRNASGLTLGAQAINFRNSQVDIAEVLIYNAVKSAADEASIEAYLKNYWATP